MPRYKVCYIDGKKEISSRTIDTSNHEDAYKRYLEIDGLKNFPIKTYSFGDRTEMLWREHGEALHEAHKASTNEQVEKQFDLNVNQELGIKKKQFELSKLKGDQQIAKKESEISLILTKLDNVVATLGRIKIGITDAASLRSSEGITKKQGTFILILLLAGLGLHPLSQFSMPTKWEYIIAAPSDTSFENEMDRLGKKGWELVNARRASSSYSASYECILKRKVSVLNFGKK
jgi:hypothetical protein